MTKSTSPSPKPVPAKTTQQDQKRRLQIILLTSIMLGLAVLDIILLSRRPLTPHRVTSSQNAIRVLFIGNSYTAANNLPGLLIELTANESKPIDAEMLVIGGARLADHWAQGSALAAIKRQKWDYVVLQEQSTLGSSVVVDGIDQIADPALFHQHVRLFNSEIEKVGAETILYLTWARHNAPQNQARLTKAYMDIAHELHLMVAPVGLAWQQVLTTNPSLVLHQDDGSHPNPAGSYLTACVFYATIYHKSPEGLSPHITSNLQSGDVNLNPSDAQILQHIAWQTVSTP